MRPVVSIGTQSFEKLRQNKSFYVDKTDLIKEWWGNHDDVTLITRPRRFGKTLNLDMLNCFFSNCYAERSELFEGLSIWKDEEYRKVQGTYPVIFMTFADVKGPNYHLTRMGIVHKLVKLYSEFNYVREILDEREREYFDTVSAKMDDDIAVMAVKSMTEFLHRYYGKKVIVLLDEYDTPLQEAYVNGYWKELAEFIRSMFNAAFKTNPSMERGLLTGITRVSKESVFSDLNNLTVVTTTSEMYRTQFGFTEEEVFRSLDLFGMSDEKEMVKIWYDGFSFGSQKGVYNPWSITGFLKEKVYKPYWANSSANSLVNSLIRQGNSQTKMIMEDLMAGKELTTEIDEEIIFDQLQKKPGAIWSMLLASGYLKVVEKNFCQETGIFTYVLQLTNREVLLMFRSMIKGWFSDEDVPYNLFLKALLLEDIDYMNEYMNEVAELTFSSFDTGNKPSGDANPERFYHGFVLGLIVELAGKYMVLSNRESGFGRYDVLLEPLDKQSKAFVLEFKVRNSRREETLEDTLAAALDQIEKKGYDTDLMARGFTKDKIRHYGFAFEGKKVLIG